MNKKGLSRIAVSICTVLFLTGVILWGYIKIGLHEKQADIDLYTLVPAECEAILETRDINMLYKNIRQSCFQKEYNDLHVSELLNFLTANLETLSNQQAHGLSTEMSQLLISFHQPGTTHDQVVYGRISESDKDFIKELMLRNSSPQFPPKTVKYKGEEITIYPLGRNFLACYFQRGFFAISLQKRLIEEVIDAYKDKRSINENRVFAATRKQHKRNEALSLYLRSSQPQDKWKEFDIRMNAGAIYLTGGENTGEACTILGNELTKQTPLNRIDETGLPRRIQTMWQRPFILQADSLQEAEEARFMGWLTKYGCQEVDAIVFTPLEKEKIQRQILLFPMTESHVEEIKRELRYYRRAVARHIVQGVTHYVWKYPSRQELHPYFALPQEEEQTDYFISFYKHCMLVATDAETLKDYIEEVSAPHEMRPTENKLLYEYCLNDLAEQAHFTMVTDMNDMMNSTTEPTPQGDSWGLPLFFYKHKEFFKNFMLSTQLIYADGSLNTNLILTYQGDSLLYNNN